MQARLEGTCRCLWWACRTTTRRIAAGPCTGGWGRNSSASGRRQSRGKDEGIAGIWGNAPLLLRHARPAPRTRASIVGVLKTPGLEPNSQRAPRAGHLWRTEGALGSRLGLDGTRRHSTIGGDTGYSVRHQTGAGTLHPHRWRGIDMGVSLLPPALTLGLGKPGCLRTIVG